MLDDRPHRDRAEHQQRPWQQRHHDADKPDGDGKRNEDDPAGAHGRFPRTHWMVPTLFVRTPTRPRSSRVSRDFVFGEEVGSAVGQQPHQRAGTSGRRHHHGHPPAGPQHPGHLGQRRRRFRYQLQHRDGQSPRRRSRRGTEVAARPRAGNRLADPPRHAPRGPASARRCRRRGPVPSGPAARASEAVTLPGPLPTSSAMPPGGMSSHSVGCCKGGHQLARDDLRPVVEHRPDGRGPRRLDGVRCSSADRLRWPECCPAGRDSPC